MHQLSVQAYLIDNDEGPKKTEMLTCSTVRATFPIRYSSISAGDHRTGDLSTHSSRVLKTRQIEYMINYTSINQTLLKCVAFLLFMIYIWPLIHLHLLRAAALNKMIVSQYRCEHIIQAAAQHLTLNRLRESVIARKVLIPGWSQGSSTDMGQGKEGYEARVLSADLWRHCEARLVTELQTVNVRLPVQPGWGCGGNGLLL